MTEQELLSNRINYYCKIRRLTYYQLSYRSTVPLTTSMSILHGETKNPGIFTIAKICNGLDVTISEFFSAEEFKNIEFETE